jgi:hypothetical protein
MELRRGANRIPERLEAGFEPKFITEPKMTRL